MSRSLVSELDVVPNKEREDNFLRVTGLSEQKEDQDMLRAARCRLSFVRPTQHISWASGRKLSHLAQAEAVLAGREGRMSRISKLGVEMIRILTKGVTAFLLSLGCASVSQAVPVTINMTADNAIDFGGYCFDSTCTAGTTWYVLGSMPNAADWRQIDTIVIDLEPGTHYFAWSVLNLGAQGADNPSGLLAEILWDGQVNYSSSEWDVLDIDSKEFVAKATEHGVNGGANIWTTANGGPVSGISTDARWIYLADNFSSQMVSPIWVRTSITISAAPEPSVVTLLTAGLLVSFSAIRRKQLKEKRGRKI